MENFIFILTFISIIGCGIIGGIFFAFSTFIMQALARLNHSEGIKAMQNINVTVLNPWFLATFMGTAVICFILALSTYWTWGQPGTIFLFIGSLLYFIGTFLVTVFFNVPKNNTLEKMESTTVEASDYWTGTYLSMWTFWNHVRTIAAILGAILLIFALVK